MEDLIAKDKKLLRATHNTLKKMSLVAAFTADLSLDTLQFSAKALAFNVVARKNIKVDQDAQVRLATVPFSG